MEGPEDLVNSPNDIHLRNISEKKLVFTNIQINDEFNSPNKMEYSYTDKISVKEIALKYYRNKDLKGLISEKYWSFIYGLLFWNIIFMKSEHCLNISPVHPQYDYYYNRLKNNEIDMPNDFFKDTFYIDRINAIQSRFEELRKSDISEEIKKSYNAHYNKPCRAIDNWNRFTLDELLIAPTHLHNEQLLTILERLIKNFKEYTLGFPELIIYNSKELFFVEVQGRNDKLSEKQIKWQEYLLTKSKINTVLFTMNKTEGQITSIKNKYNNIPIIQVNDKMNLTDLDTIKIANEEDIKDKQNNVAKIREHIRDEVAESYTQKNEHDLPVKEEDLKGKQNKSVKVEKSNDDHDKSTINDKIIPENNKDFKIEKPEEKQPAIKLDNLKHDKAISSEKLKEHVNHINVETSKAEHNTSVNENKSKKNNNGINVNKLKEYIPVKVEKPKNKNIESNNVEKSKEDNNKSFNVNKLNNKQNIKKEHAISFKTENTEIKLDKSINVETSKKDINDSVKLEKLGEHENTIKKSKNPIKVTIEEKYMLISYLNQIKYRPCLTNIRQLTIIDNLIDSSKIEEYAVKQGYLNKLEGTDKLNTVINSYRIMDLKEILRKHNLKITGRKQELIDRLRDNLNRAELNKEFDKKCYTVTVKGQRLLKNNPQVKFYESHFKHHSLKEYEAFYQENKNIGNMMEVSIKYLEDVGDENINKCKWFSYKWQSIREIAYIYYENDNYEKALNYFIELFICDLNYWDNNCNSMNQDNYINDQYITKLINTINILHLDIISLESIFNKCCINTKIPMLIIPKTEMFRYFIETINEEDINKINEDIKKRINTHHRLNNLHFNSKKEEKEIVNIIKEYPVYK